MTASQHTHRSARIGGLLSLGLLLASALTVAIGCANSASSTRASAPTSSGMAPASRSAAAPSTVATDDDQSPGDVFTFADSPIAAVLNDLGDDAKAYHAHVTTLSDPFFGGRQPGTHGFEVASDYIEFYFKSFGLEPAFEQYTTSATGADEILEPSYTQPFTVPGKVRIDKAQFSWNTPNASATLTPETDFDPMPFTDSGQVSGPVEFIGYGIESGPDNYTSFPADTDLTGKIALVLRFEPMDSRGKSLWAKTGRWSRNAGLVPKIRAATDRGAVGVILVNPPGADDPRASQIMSVRDSRFGGQGDVPVVMITKDAAERLIIDADAQGRSLMDLRKLADAGGLAPIEFSDLTTSIDVAVGRDEIATNNVGAVLPGKGALRNEYIVIGAHFDHLGMGAYGTRFPGKLHPGADDNASGTSGVLLAAEKLSTVYADLKPGVDARSILFLTFSAEEMGLLGSKHFVEDPPIALSQIDAMLNMDMIGRLRNGDLEILGVGAGAQFESTLNTDARDTGLHLKLSALPGGRSDHASFIDQGVPAVAFFSGFHSDYHAPGDVGSKISTKGAVRVVDLVSAVAFDLATRPQRITFTKEKTADAPATPRMNITVRLGVAPGNYADETAGVLVGAVYDDTSAALAGVKKGDRIIRWNGEELLDVQGMMKQLAAAKPGDVARVVVERNGKEVTLNVTLQARPGAD